MSAKVNAVFFLVLTLRPVSESAAGGGGVVEAGDVDCSASKVEERHILNVDDDELERNSSGFHDGMFNAIISN